MKKYFLNAFIVILSVVGVSFLLQSSPSLAAGACRSIDVSSNFPTTWTITGPNGVRVEDPDGSGASTGFSVDETSTGGALPEGDYRVSVQNTVSGGQNPYYERVNGGDGQTNASGYATFECVGGTRLDVTVTYGGDSSAGGSLQFLNTPLDFSETIHSGGVTDQKIIAGHFIGGHFVFRGSSCMINMNSELANGATGGGGLWSISESGTAVQERQLCIDAGAASNNLYFHAHNNGSFYADGGPSFLNTNASAAAYLSPTTSGPGANKAVLYGFAGSQLVVQSASPQQYFNNQLVNVFSGGYSVGDREVVRTSDWDEVGSAPDVPFAGSLGGYFIGRSNSGGIGRVYKQYKLQNDNVVEVGDLPGNIRSLALQFAYDYSKSPTELVILDPGIISNANYVDPRILWFRVGSSGFELTKEMELPSEFEVTGHFGVWGDYLLRGFATNGGGVLVGKANGSTYTKTQTLVLPDGGRPWVILTSPSGNVAITTSSARNETSTTQQNPGGLRTQVHIYKIGGAVPAPTPTPGTTPGSTPSPYDIFDGPSEPFETVFGAWLRVLRGVSYE